MQNTIEPWHDGPDWGIKVTPARDDAALAVANIMRAVGLPGIAETIDMIATEDDVWNDVAEFLTVTIRDDDTLRDTRGKHAIVLTHRTSHDSVSAEPYWCLSDQCDNHVDNYETYCPSCDDEIEAREAGEARRDREAAQR